MPTDLQSESFFDGPAHALVIGISKYKYRYGSDMEGPTDNGFPSLTFAAKDAQDFSDFLTASGFIKYNVQTLLNEQATQDEIQKGLIDLRRRCRQSENPLVVVYFSGHGWAEKDGDQELHYLIPYDAQRDQLEITALSNRRFMECLDALKTKRLVVFLDACHAGDIAEPGGKGLADMSPYHIPSELGVGEGRFFIASCGPGQKSYESKTRDNSIFTGHLLDLLKCETEDFDELNKAEINIFDLYPVLAKKVKQTADEQYQKDQEPISEVKGGKGIVLAINQKMRERQIQVQDHAHKAQIEFTDLLCKYLRSLKDDRDSLAVEWKIEAYVEKGESDPGYDDFYKGYTVYFGYWQEGKNRVWIEECASRLIRAHRQVVESRKTSQTSVTSSQVSPLLRPAQTPLETIRSAGKLKTLSTQNAKPAERAEFVDEFRKAGEGGAALETSEAIRVSVGFPAPGEPPQKEFSSKDIEYILEPISTKKYYSLSSALTDLLTQPTTEANFIKRVLKMRAANKDDLELRELLDKIVSRFGKRWSEPESDNGEETEEPLTMRPAADVQSPVESKPTNVFNARMAAISGQPFKAERSKVFVSYSPKDEKYFKELKDMFDPLIRSGAIDLWDDTKFEGEQIWRDEIEKGLSSSRVALLLVSQNYLKSGLIVDNKLPPLLSAAEDNDLTVYWICVSTCLYEETEISKYQPAHDPARPLDDMAKVERAKVLKSIADQIKKKFREH